MMHWLFPNKCIVCLDIIASSPTDGFCETCKGALTVIDAYCDVCGQMMQKGYACECEGHDFVFVKNRSVFVYDAIMSDVIHAFKYGNHPAHGKVLGKIMASRFNCYFEHIDLIMPTPMYRAKERLRGFNQAALLAREIALHTGITYDNKSLIRVRDTTAQSGLSAAEREANLSNAFKWVGKPGSIAGKNILLVDDIMTTGSTLNECATALLREGCLGIYGYTLAAAIKINKIQQLSENIRYNG